MNIKAILFDLDDTLYDRKGRHPKALRTVYYEFNKHHKIAYRNFLKLYTSSKQKIHQALSGTASSHNRMLYFQRVIEE